MYAVSSYFFRNRLHSHSAHDRPKYAISLGSALFSFTFLNLNQNWYYRPYHFTNNKRNSTLFYFVLFYYYYYFTFILVMLVSEKKSPRMIYWLFNLKLYILLITYQFARAATLIIAWGDIAIEIADWQSYTSSHIILFLFA